MQPSVAELTIISIGSISLLTIISIMIFVVTMLRLLRIQRLQQQVIPVYIPVTTQTKSPIAPEVLQELMFRQHAYMPNKVATKEMPQLNTAVSSATQEARAAISIKIESNTKNIPEQSYKPRPIST